jgi:hypothetical protein
MKNVYCWNGIWYEELDDACSEHFDKEGIYEINEGEPLIRETKEFVSVSNIID